MLFYHGFSFLYIIIYIITCTVEDDIFINLSGFDILNIENIYLDFALHHLKINQKYHYLEYFR